MIAKWGAALLAASAVANAATEMRPAKRNPLHNRDVTNDIILKPVKYQTNVLKRQGNPFTPDHQLDMEYCDMETYNNAQVDTFGATVHIGTYDPAVQTEQFGNEITDVQCSNNNSMTIKFADANAMNQAKQAWNVPSLTIITRTAGCNQADERVPWNLTNFKFADNQVVMDAHKMTWQTASVKFTVDFGSRGNITNPNAPPSNGAALRKRDSATDLGFSLKDKVLFTEDKVGLTQSCKDCHGTGKATIRAGAFDIKNIVETIGKPIEDGANKVKDGLENAWKGIFGRDLEMLEKRSIWSDLASKFDKADLNIDLENYGASFLFESKLDSFKEFQFHLAGQAGIGLPGLSIKDILSIGPNIDPMLVASVQMAEPITFTYGFEFNMPNGAGLTLNFLDPTKSSLNKIKDTTFRALPFNTNFKEAKKGFNFTIAFRPVISLGVKFLGHEIDPVELTMDVPKFSGAVDLVLDSDKDCKGKGNIDAFSFNSNFGFDVGVGANVQLLGAVNFAPSAMLFSTAGIAPMSTCVPFHTGAAKTTTTAAATTTAKATSKTSDAGSGTKPTGSSSGGSQVSGAAKPTGKATSTGAHSSMITAAPGYGTPHGTGVVGYHSVSSSGSSVSSKSANSTQTSHSMYSTRVSSQSTVVVPTPSKAPGYGAQGGVSSSVKPSASSASTTTTSTTSKPVAPTPPAYGAPAPAYGAPPAPPHYKERRHARSF